MEPGSTPAVTIAELEAALGEIAEVRAARIVASPDGRIDEVHVLGLPGKAPKQLVRDVESCLIAGFGIMIDRRKISVAQIGIAERPAVPVQIAPVPEPGPEPELEVVPASEAITGAVSGTRLRVLGVHSDSDSLRVSVRVRIDRDGVEADGEASGPAGTNMRQRLVAEATLRAVEASYELPGGYAVEEVAVTMLGGRQVAVCSIVTVTAEGEEALSGSAIVRHTVESATVRATLDALNRRIGL
jgi:hypothetical protein